MRDFSKAWTGRILSPAGPLSVFMLVLAATMLFLTPAPAAAQGGTCTVAFGTVPYASTDNTHTIAENSAEMLACDRRYPAADSGVAHPLTGVSVGGGSWTGTTENYSNRLTYTPEPRWVGPDSYTMYFCNDMGCTGPGRLTATVNVTVAAPTISLTASLPNGTVAAAYSQTLTASGSASPYTFSVLAGSLPPGLSLGVVSNPTTQSSTVTLSGTPTAGGTFNFTIRATDNSIGTGPLTKDQAYSVVITTPTITIAPPTLPGGIRNAAYSQALSASGGTAGYTWSISGGALPAGLTLSTAGVLSGTPTETGSFNFTVRAQDSSTGDGPYAGARAYAFTIADAAPAVGAVSAMVAYGSSNNPITLNLSGGTPTSVAVSTPPTNGTATAAGSSITYTPTAGYAGPDSFTYTATNAAGTSSPATVSITISPPTLMLSPASLPDGTMDVAYSQATTASGGQAPYSYGISSGALPAGLMINSTTGEISGTPTSPGTSTFTVHVQDSSTGPAAPFATARSYTVTIQAPSVVITSPSAGALPGAMGGAAYSQTFTASGGQGAHSFSLTSGALPTGITLTSAGVLSGTPIVSGTFNFSIRASDSSPGPAGPFNSAPVSYSLTVAAPTITVSPPTLPAATMAVGYSQAITAVGGTGAHSFSLSAGALPTGLSLTSAGVLSGVPTVTGTYNFTVTAADTHGFAGARAYTLVVAAPVIAITSPSAGALPSAVAGTAYSQTFTASGGQGAHSFSLVGGALPTGMVFTSAGVLSGTPTVSGTFNFSIQAGDSSPTPGPFIGGVTAYSLTVAAPSISVSPTTLPTAITAAAYNQTITATGGTGAHSFSISAGSLPSGMLLSSVGVLSGTPTASGTSNFTVTAVDSLGFTGSTAYSFTVVDPVIAITSPSAGALPSAVGGTAYSQTFTASGGQGAHSFSLVTGALPTGMSFTSGGVLSGTPTVSGTFNFSIRASDSSPGPGGPFNSTPVFYSLTVNAPTIAITPATGALPGGLITVAYDQTFTATGGAAPYTFSLASGALPTGLTLTSAGVLSGTPDLAGSYAFDVQATDTHGFTRTAAYTLLIGTPLPVVAPQTATVTGGQSVVINVTTGAAGGPFIGATIVTPPTHGTALVSGLAIVYSADGAYAGTDTFTYALSNAGGASTPASVTVTVNPAVVPAPPKTVTILAGQSAVVNLTDGAAGGPFTAATVVTLSPSGAGQATISARSAPGGQAFDLTFTPENAFAGTAEVSYTLSNALTTSAPGLVTIIVEARPDPSQDPDVTGLVNAQNDTARRFASAQISNINRRLERLHSRAGSGGFSSNIALRDVGAGGDEFSFDPIRRMREERLGGPLQPDSIALPFGLDPAQTPVSGDTDGRFGLWASGSANFGERRERSSSQGVRFTTDGLTVGADYRVTDRLALGVGLGYARDISEVGDHDTRSRAQGYSSAIYASVLPTDKVFIDGVLGYGTLDFSSRRFVTAANAFAYGQRDGDQWFGSITAGTERRGERLNLSPYGRMEASRYSLNAFSELGTGAYDLTFDDQVSTIVTGVLGLRGDYTMPTRFGAFIPSFRYEYSYDFRGSGLTMVRYADWIGGPAYQLLADPLEKDRMLFGIGMDLMYTSGARIGLDYEGVLSGDGDMERVRLVLLVPF